MFASIAGTTKEQAIEEQMLLPVIVVAILLIFIGLFAFLAVLLRLVQHRKSRLPKHAGALDEPER